MIHEHQWTDSEQVDYDICSLCGTYKSTAILPRKDLYENNYWSKASGRSTMIEQVYNLTETNTRDISKVDKILSYVKQPGWLLEIGCAPGILLRRAIAMGCAVTGVEPDADNVPEIVRIAGTREILHGYFPECMPVDLHFQNYIIAMDVVEHVTDYKAFFWAAHRLLYPGGKFIFMSPITTAEAPVREKDFIAGEHAFVFHENYLSELLGEMFSDVQFDIWQPGHNIVVCTK